VDFDGPVCWDSVGDTTLTVEGLFGWKSYEQILQELGRDEDDGMTANEANTLSGFDRGLRYEIETIIATLKTHPDYEVYLGEQCDDEDGLRDLLNGVTLFGGNKSVSWRMQIFTKHFPPESHLLEYSRLLPEVDIAVGTWSRSNGAVEVYGIRNGERSSNWIP
jgi:hypothetical protein